jgi:DNA mismatch endonuclease (patch repair protein)
MNVSGPFRDQAKLEKPDPKRSALMARVRQRGTAPEQVVALLLRGLGFAYRRHVRLLAGAPDFSNRKRKWALYVQGCFWHHHTACARATVPKANEAFWREKFAANRRRDAKALRALRRAGFRVVVVWECETLAPAELSQRLARALPAINSVPRPQLPPP